MRPSNPAPRRRGRAPSRCGGSPPRRSSARSQSSPPTLPPPPAAGWCWWPSSIAALPTRTSDFPRSRPGFPGAARSIHARRVSTCGWRGASPSFQASERPSRAASSATRRCGRSAASPPRSASQSSSISPATPPPANWSGSCAPTVARSAPRSGCGPRAPIPRLHLGGRRLAQPSRAPRRRAGRDLRQGARCGAGGAG